ncbi:pteridine reductase [Aurantivibrio plasticivorans]
MSYQPVVLITGAARRIGAEVSSLLHSSGFNVIIHCNQSLSEAEALCEQLNRARQDSAAIVSADLCDLHSINNLANQATEKWGRLDALVNNASSFYPTAVGEISESIYDDLFGTNLKAPLFLSQACAPALKEAQGCIINMADIHGERPLTGYPVYCMAKAANIMLTKALAKELAPDIRVNGVAPGAILWPENAAELDERAKDIIIDRAALKRIGNPQDIAQTILFLIKNSPYITGQIIAVDGGRNLIS